MLGHLKKCLREALFKCGYDLRRVSHSPFGFRWERDIAFFPNGRALETVLDVGANTGQTALSLIRRFPASHVYSFEPVESTFNVLVENTGAHPNITPICSALGAEPGSARMIANALSQSNTLKLGSLTDIRPEAVVEVDVQSVDAFCKERDIRHVGLLKIDTEGAEMDVLRGARELLAAEKIDFILAECDFLRRKGEPHGDFVEIYDHVSRFGFCVVSFYTGGVDDSGWVWGDVLFRRASKSVPIPLACSPSQQQFG